VATIDEAKAYCDDLEAGGFDDWKLPLAVQFAGRLLYATGALPKDACTLADAENHPGCAHCEDSPVCMAMFPEDATSNARYWAFGSRLGEEPWAINLTFSHLYEIPQNYQDPPHQIKCIR
jgi:hypothetical protein